MIWFNNEKLKVNWSVDQMILFTTFSNLSIYLNSFMSKSFLCFYCLSLRYIIPLNFLTYKANIPFSYIWTSNSAFNYWASISSFPFSSSVEQVSCLREFPMESLTFFKLLLSDVTVSSKDWFLLSHLLKIYFTS